MYVFTEEGVYVKANQKHVESLLRLYELEGRKAKQVPEHCLLGQPDTSPELDSKRQAVFRSGLGIAMYMSHDRCDIQYCVRTLASSMKTPTEHAEKCLIQLILYLKGTQGFAFKLPYTPVGTRLASKLNNAPELEQDDNIHVMEVFCDSDWAGSLYRKSTTSVMILLNGLLALSYSRTQNAVALSSCEAEVLALTSGVSEAILLQKVWKFMLEQEVLLEARSDSSSGRQWLQRSGLGRLKHIDVRLCWLQEAIRGHLVKALPFPTQTNVSDLNTKKLTSLRRKFLLSFLGATRLDEQNNVVEVIGEHEQVNYFAELSWKQQVRQVNRWLKNKATRHLVQCSLFVQAMSLKGCVEEESRPGGEQVSQQQFVMTILILILVWLCNWVYNNWDELARRFCRRGQRRKRSQPVDIEEPEPERDRDARASDDPVPETPTTISPRPPQFPPMPIDPPARWAVWSPEWFTYWMLGRVQRRIDRRGANMSEEERKKYYKRREILQSVLSILEQRPGETARRRAHNFCRSMTDLSVDEETEGGEEVPELEEPEAERSERIIEESDARDGYFTSSNLPGRNFGSSSSSAVPATGTSASAISRPDRDMDTLEDQEEEDELESDPESEDTRVARYLHSTLSEVSDPEMWMNLHH